MNSPHTLLMPLAMLLAGLLLAGCRTEPTIAGDPSFPTRHTYNVPAKQLYERTKGVLGTLDLSVESESEGRLVTAWKPETGAKFGAMGLGRTWQERTRYTITISPAWDDPTGKSTIEVSEETQQRPHDKYEWGSQDPIKRPERAAELSRKLDQAMARTSS